MENINYKKLEETIARGVAFGILRFIAMIFIFYMLLVITVFAVVSLTNRGDDKCIHVGNMVNCPNLDSQNRIDIL